MKKRGIFLAIIVFLILIAIANASNVDPKVKEELKDKEEVSVIIMLNDDVQMERDFSVLSDQPKKFLLEKKIKNRKLMVRKQQNKVLSSLKIKQVKKEKGLLSSSKDYDFKLKHTYSIINGFSGKVTKKGLKKLKNNQNVAKIYYDDVRHFALENSVPQINADDVWPLVPNGLNLTGQNQTVCVIDGGIDYTHPNLGNCSTENFTSGNCDKVISGWDYKNNDNDPRDDQGHGTHVAGIVASNHSTNRGVAPDAKLVALKVCDDTANGNCVVSDIVSAIDWCIDNRTKFNISIITMSLGDGSYDTSCDAQVDANALNVAVANGLFVSAATGNDASSTQIHSPACGSNVTAVGSVDSDDLISSFSNRAAFNTIFAPGRSITSTVPISGASQHTSATGFKAISGTSMATPHVAGVAALMLQFNSSLSPLDIRKIMNDTGKAIDDSGTTYKRVDALAAIQSMDGIAPVWSNNATNNTAPKKNNVVQFNITWNDTIGLSFYKFSWNDTGSWVNITNGTLSGTSQSISVNQSITASTGEKVYWKFYANDTNNNWNMTDEWYFTVTSEAPYEPTLNFPLNDTIIRVNYTILNWTASDPDNDSMNCYIYGDNQSNTTSLINITKNIANGTSSTYNWTNLNETTYYWKVQCDDGISNSSNSSIRQFTIAIPPTTYPSLTSVADYDSDGNIEINWTDDGNETSETYRIYRFARNITSINSSVTNLTIGISNGTQFFEDNTTTNGTTYWYVLVTVDSAGNYNDSVFSNSLNGTANDTIKPKTVTNANVTASGATATLKWYNVSQDINNNPDSHNLQYVIYYGTNFNSSKALANESITSPSTTTVSINYTTISVTSSGTYHFVVTALDDGNNKNLTLDYSNNYGNASLTYTPPSTSSSGGGGSGGGGGGGVAISTATSETINTGAVAAGGTARAEFTKDIGVTNVDVTVKQTVTASTVTVADMGPSSGIASAPVKETDKKSVYKYLKITVGKISSSNIKEAVIKFKIPKKEGYNPSTVELRRYDSWKKIWSSLPTKFTSEVGDYHYFKTDTPGFSIFAIVGEKGYIEEVKKEVNISTIQEVEEEPEEKVEEVKPKEKIKPLGWALLIIIPLIIFLVITYIIFHTKKHKKSSE